MTTRISDMEDSVKIKHDDADPNLVGNILAITEEALKYKDLQKEAKALLLLRLLEKIIQSEGASKEVVDRYWDQLKRINPALPNECRDDFFKIKSIMEPGKEKVEKGFAAEALAQITVAENQLTANPDQARAILLEVEEGLKSRSWPMGKGAVQAALVMAWARIDRSSALDRMKDIPKKEQADLVRDLNKTLLITPEEWEELGDTLGHERVAEMVWEKIAPEHTICRFSREMLTRLASLMTKWAKRKFDVTEAMTRLGWLMVGSSMLPEVRSSVYEDLFRIFANANLGPMEWLEKFRLMRDLIAVGVQTAAVNEERMEKLIETVPPYLKAYSQAHHVASIAMPESIEMRYMDLKRKTQNDGLALGWFLVWLVVRGYSKEALEVAEKSGRFGDLSQRVRRAWLNLDLNGARQHLHAEDFAGDPVGEFLCQGSLSDRVAYLQRVTKHGMNSLPGPMWVVPPVEEVKKGLFGIKVKPKKTFDEQAQDYLSRTPLYSYIPPQVKEVDQFEEFIRIVAYGEYRYQVLDPALLEALITWAANEPDAVRSLLKSMWEEIRPEDFVIFNIPVRTAILQRCSMVFAADKEVLVDDFAVWLHQEWVRKGRKAKVNGKDVEVKLPDTTLLHQCLTAALAADTYSAAHKDDILIYALERLNRKPERLNLFAYLYNKDKAPFEFTPPLQLKGKELAAWQRGVVQASFASISRMPMDVKEVQPTSFAQVVSDLTGVISTIEQLQPHKNIPTAITEQPIRTKAVTESNEGQNLINLKDELSVLPSRYPAQAISAGGGVAQAREQIPIICQNIDDAIQALNTGRDRYGNSITRGQIADGLKRLIAATRKPEFIGLLVSVLNGEGIQQLEKSMGELEGIATRIGRPEGIAPVEVHADHMSVILEWCKQNQEQVIKVHVVSFVGEAHETRVNTAEGTIRSIEEHPSQKGVYRLEFDSQKQREPYDFLLLGFEVSSAEDQGNRLVIHKGKNQRIELEVIENAKALETHPDLQQVEEQKPTIYTFWLGEIEVGRIEQITGFVYNANGVKQAQVYSDGSDTNHLGAGSEDGEILRTHNQIYLRKVGQIDQNGDIWSLATNTVVGRIEPVPVPKDVMCMICGAALTLFINSLPVP